MNSNSSGCARSEPFRNAIINQRDRDITSDHLVNQSQTSKLKLKRSGIHGFGVFSTELIEGGKRLIEYTGEKIRESLADTREARYKTGGIQSCYFFKIEPGLIIDARKCGNVARFINHSCDVRTTFMYCVIT